MVNIPTLILQSLSSDAGVKDVRKSLTGDSDVTFVIQTQKVTDNENELIMTFLTSVYSADPLNYALIIRDTSITAIGPDKVANYIKELVDLNNEGVYTFDICLLGRFLDNCNQYSDTRSLSNTNGTSSSTVTVTDTSSYISRTTGSKGVEAIFFAPSGMTKYFNDVTKYPSFNETIYYAVYGINGKDGVMKGISFNPSLYSFNPIWSNSMSDYVRTASCSNTKPAAAPSTTTGTALQFFIFIIVIVLILILAWYAFKLTPQPIYAHASL